MFHALPLHPATWLVGLWLLLWSALSGAEVAVPTLQSRVTDPAGLLDAATVQALEAKLAGLEQAKGSQIAVLIVPTTQPETVEQYALRVAEAWQLGRKGVDDGALLLVARDERALRIEVGYGLEGVIPDAVAKRIIAEIVTPRFQAGDYPGGIQAGVDALIGLVQGEPLPAPKQDGRGAVSFLENTLPVAMLFIFVVGGILRAVLGRFLGAGVAGGVAFFGAWLLLGSLLTGLAIALVVFVFTLLGGRGIGGRGMGGGFGGGGFGGGGFGGGGFSGGGGGFGGGGASGRW